jgi:hypothetical protein
VKVRPAIVALPVRLSPRFLSIVSWTVPLPVPDSPLVSEIQDAPLDAVHVHVDRDAVTVTTTRPPEASTVWLSGEIENVHGGGAAA